MNHSPPARIPLTVVRTLTPLIRKATLHRVQGRLRARHDSFDDLTSYCAFLGHPRSGHTLIAALVNAHPEAVISQELNTLDYIRLRLGRRSIFGMILWKDLQFVQNGSHGAGGFSFQVPGQWQGRYSSLRVIGDKHGHGTALWACTRPSLIRDLATTVQVPLKFVQVTRHPADNIARIALRANIPLQDAIDLYLRICQGCAEVRRRWPVYDVALEALIANPTQELADLFSWLDLTPDDRCVTACSSIVFKQPRRARDQVPWTAPLWQQVVRRGRHYDFLGRYLSQSPHHVGPR